MKSYQPLLLSKLDIRVPGFHIRKLELHRHHAETASLRAHAHPWSQCLCYLGGRGSQEVAGRPHPVQPGSMVFLPPGVRHAFRREADRRPICLAIDFDWSGEPPKDARIDVLPGSATRELRNLLGRLGRLNACPEEPPSLAASALVLAILDVLLFGVRGGAAPALAQKVSATLRALPEASLGEVARRTGYQRDSLNRRLKVETGLTLGQWKARQLLQRAKELLPLRQEVAQVAEEVGFNDPNYFSRWFRLQTGLTPMRWKHSHPRTAVRGKEPEK